MKLIQQRLVETSCYCALFRKWFSQAVLFIAFCNFSSLVYSQDDFSAAQETEIDAIIKILNVSQPSLSVTSVSLSPIAGLYQVNLSDSQSLFASADGKYFIPGDLYEVRNNGLVNLGERKRNALRSEKIASLDEADMLIFDVPGERKATLTVFTDVDCPYCRKLHAEVPQLNALGIAVRYLAYPRTGLNTPTHHKMVSVWCAENKKAAFTTVNHGGEIEPITCDNPVAEHYQLGREVEVTGTPALVLEDGTLLPGYIPVATLAGYLLSGM